MFTRADRPGGSLVTTEEPGQRVAQTAQLMSRVCILNTGGTIGMRESARGLCPEPGYLLQQLQAMPELSASSMPELEVVEYDPVIDSANMTPEHWLRIADDIVQRHVGFDGFVVLHGTDTMAYSSSALAFLLPALSRPVILTGSQLPLSHVRNDARENLKTAILLAGSVAIPEVCLFFGEVLLRGCRATKTSATRLDAFDSPNYPPLGSAETALEVFTDRLREPPAAGTPLTVAPLRSVELATFRLFPGMSPAVLRHLLQSPLEALILESFGVGNGPAANREFIETVAAATRNGIVIVNCTQCRHGCVSQAEYEVGRMLADAGVTSGRDMTMEAALAKLQVLFSSGAPVDEIRSQLGQSLVGELTPEPANTSPNASHLLGTDSGRVRIRGASGNPSR